MKKTLSILIDKTIYEKLFSLEGKGNLNKKINFLIETYVNNIDRSWIEAANNITSQKLEKEESIEFDQVNLSDFND